MNETLQKLEALLFLAGEAVSYRELAQLIGASVNEAMVATQELRAALADHGLTVVTTATHAQLTTSPHVTQYLQQFLRGETDQLSAAAAETLAIIAYRGPIDRPSVEAIRGVDCRRMIRQLTARGLIRRQKIQGRLPVYSVTEDFLQHVGVTQAQDLPRYTELSQDPKLEQISPNKDEFA